MANQEETRFRSFAERYVIERASTFRVGHEDEDGWIAVQRAKTAYKQIAEIGQATYPDPVPQNAQQLGQGAPNSGGPYGPYGV